MTAGWRLDVTPPARRDLRRLDPPVRRRVLLRLASEERTVYVLRVLPRGRAYER